MNAPPDNTVLAQIAKKLSADDARAIIQQKLGDEAEGVSFWSYDDLVAMRITQSRGGLHFLQKDWGFPAATPLGGRRSGFHKPAVKRWVEAQLAKPQPRPGARTHPLTPKAAPRKRGRPRKVAKPVGEMEVVVVT